MASIHEVLGELRSVAYDERDKGARFEKLVQAFLRTEPEPDPFSRTGSLC